MAKPLKSLVTWLGTVVAQWVAANLCVFLFSLLWFTDRPTTMAQFLTVVAFIGAGFLIGVYGAGIQILHMRRQADLQARSRFISTLVFILVPLLALVILAWRISPARQPEFQTIIVENWQITFAQIALWASILGFHLPGWLKRWTRPMPVILREAV